MHEPADNNSNTINTTQTTMHILFLLNEGIDSLDQSFDMQLQDLSQISLAKSNSKETNANNKSDILIHLLKKN